MRDIVEANSGVKSSPESHVYCLLGAVNKRSVVESLSESMHHHHEPWVRRRVRVCNGSDAYDGSEDEGWRGDRKKGENDGSTTNQKVVILVVNFWSERLSSLFLACRLRTAERGN